MKDRAEAAEAALEDTNEELSMKTSTAATYKRQLREMREALKRTNDHRNAMGNKLAEAQRQLREMREALKLYVHDFEVDFCCEGIVISEEVPDWKPLVEHYHRARAALASQPDTKGTEG
jgi:gamma-glutamyl:cysteine ligase YbdK (ATP-grasp superfamily)